MANDNPPANVVSVETTVRGDSEEVVIVAETKPKKDSELRETIVEAKIERKEEQIAFFSVQQLLGGGGMKPGDCVYFEITDVDLPFPKDKSDYAAFARIEGEQWQKASPVNSISCSSGT